MRKVLILVMVFAVLGAACSESQEDAEQTLCDNLATLGSAVSSAESLDPATATVDDINDARDAISDAWNDVVSSAEDVENIQLDNSQQAVDDYQDTVSGISGDTALPEAQQQVAQAAATLQSSVAEINSQVDCSGTTTTSS